MIDYDVVKNCVMKLSFNFSVEIPDGYLMFFFTEIAKSGISGEELMNAVDRIIRTEDTLYNKIVY